MSSHIFALHAPEICQRLAHHTKQTVQHSTDRAFLHRILTVLRSREGDEYILFNGAGHVVHIRIDGCVRARGAERVSMYVVDVSTAPEYTPRITWWLPVIAKSAFEEALYALAVLGVQEIQPYTSAKTSARWGSPRDYERAQAVLIAACEQAKQYKIPLLHQVAPLTSLHASTEQGVFFDAAGIPFCTYQKSVNAPTSLTICSGPEADLSDEEKAWVTGQAGWKSVQLTPTILKAEHAVWVGGGLLRAGVCAR